jgi:hypothetical protein
MANVLDLRRRIRSVKSTRQITKAMKMIAAIAPKTAPNTDPIARFGQLIVISHPCQAVTKSLGSMYATSPSPVPFIPRAPSQSHE